MLAVKWEKRETKLPLRFQAAGYKYNKSVRNQTARDFLLVLFFYLPLKVALGNPQPRLLMTSLETNFFLLRNSKFPCRLRYGLTRYYIHYNIKKKPEFSPRNHNYKVPVIVN